MSVKAWKRAALAAYIVAGLGLAGGGYALASARINTLAMDRAIDQLTETVMANVRDVEATDTAASAAGVGLVIDARSYPVAPDWSAVAEQAMPSVTIISALERARGDGSENRAWRIPGVQQNAATAAMNRVRTWERGWVKADQERQRSNVGAGVFVADGRHVLTVAHIVQDVDTNSLRVKLPGGEWRSARVVHSSPSDDVALLEIEGEPGQSARIAPALPRQGQAVAAIGSPAGLDFAMSTGIVSRYGRQRDSSGPHPVMTIDARITSGNSGGPLVNSWGELVGVVSAQHGGFTHIVPINRALAVVGL